MEKVIPLFLWRRQVDKVSQTQSLRSKNKHAYIHEYVSDIKPGKQLFLPILHLTFRRFKHKLACEWTRMSSLEKSIAAAVELIYTVENRI
jgi:hypothetical protein